MKSYWALAGVLFAIIGYLIIISKLIGGFKKPNDAIDLNGVNAIDSKSPISMATFLLLLMLNIIILVNSILTRGNTEVVWVYTIGTFTICVLLAILKQFYWTWVETMASALIAGCLLFWWIYGSEVAITLGAVSAFIANIPQIARSWQFPRRDQIITWVTFLLCNVCFFKAGKDWSPKEVYYSIAGGVGCVILIIAHARSFRIKASDMK